MAEKKKAKYFCEGCGSEVAANAKMSQSAENSLLQFDVQNAVIWEP